jgi:hypothetical protein
LPQLVMLTVDSMAVVDHSMALRPATHVDTLIGNPERAIASIRCCCMPSCIRSRPSSGGHFPKGAA